MKRKLRGSGYKHTLPWVLPTFAVWVVVLVITAPILSITMMLSGLVPTYLHGEIWFFLLTRTPAIGVAGIALAILTSARSAGPLVQLGRAFQDVKQGDMDRRLQFRKSDTAYRGIETSFNEMMAVLSERVESGAGPRSENPGGTRPQQDENQRDLALSPEPSLLGDT